MRVANSVPLTVLFCHMKKLTQITIVLFALLVGGVAFASSNAGTLYVDGVGYAPSKISGPTTHYETPDVNPSEAYNAVHVWKGNGSEHLPCEGGIHWISNKNVLTVSHCLGDDETPTTTTTEVPTSTSTTSSVPADTTTTLPATTSTTTVPPVSTTTSPETTAPTTVVEPSTSTSSTISSTIVAVTTPPTPPTTVPTPDTVTELPETGSITYPLMMLGAVLLFVGLFLRRV